jgi:hypothetical protein
MPFNPKEHLSKSKGNKDYLEVKWRLVWLCEDVPRYRIRTQIVPSPQGVKGVTVRAEVDILDDAGNIVRSAEGHKSSFGFAGGDLEKAETGAIGRALALLGYGTQFALELETDDPDELPVDSPVDNRQQSVQQLKENGTLKPASSLPAPTNARKPKTYTPDAELEKLPRYEHDDVPAEDVVSKATVREIREVGKRLFDYTGPDLEARIVDAASKILNMRVAKLDRLHSQDANDVSNALTETAIKKGVMQAPNQPEQAAA